MGASLGAEKRAATFDLLRQPFSMLRVEPTATVAQISEAFEDASADRLASESELFAARQAVVSPRLRLAAELASLLDTPVCCSGGFWLEAVGWLSVMWFSAGTTRHRCANA
jgi:hypothetical protein